MFIPINLNEAKELRPVPNAKYDLVITGCDQTETREKKTPQFKIAIAIEGQDTAPNVNHFLGIPSDKDEAGAMSFKILLMKRFLTLFGVPIDPKGFDTDALAMEMVGARAKAELTLTEPDDNGNVYNRLEVPKLNDEGLTGGRPAPKPPKR